jgi:hypothetical protein
VQLCYWGSSWLWLRKIKAGLRRGGTPWKFSPRGFTQLLNRFLHGHRFPFDASKPFMSSPSFHSNPASQKVEIMKLISLS